MTELIRATTNLTNSAQFVLSFVMTIGVFGILTIYVMGMAVNSTPFIESLVLLTVREWIASFSFWYQSSHGSKMKDHPASIQQKSVIQQK